MIEKNGGFPRQDVTKVKKCSKCNIEKQLDDFLNCRATRSGRQSYCRKCSGEVKKAWRKDHIAQHKKTSRNSFLLRKYHIDSSQYDFILASQNGVCAGCGKSNKLEGKTSFAVDHNHITGKVRGLLCYKCNRAIGSLEDDPIVLRRLASYLESEKDFAWPDSIKQLKMGMKFEAVAA